ncbi:MAG: multiprotein-bridging factor 1 family protein [Faecousia sp.]
MKSRIENIIQARQEQGLSIQQLADMCQLSASTVSRTLSGKTEPTEYTIKVMEDALGITDKPIGDSIMDRVSNDPILERYLNMQEVRINRLRAHYNMLLAEKTRWINMLFVLSLILVSFICFILVMDVLHPDIGWIRKQLGLGYQQFKDVLKVYGDSLSNFCLVK